MNIEAFENIHGYTDMLNLFLISPESIDASVIAFFKAFVKTATDDISAQKLKDEKDTKWKRISSLR